MQTMREYSPTAFDRTGVGSDGRGDWLVVPTFRNRDSDVLARSNFDAALKRLGGEGEDVDVIRARHWGAGWVETIAVRPGTAAAEMAAKIETDLSNYPILDETAFSVSEAEDRHSSWESWGKDDLIRSLSSRYDLDDETVDTLSDADPEALRSWYEGFDDHGSWDPDDSPIRMNQVIEKIELDDVLAFVAARKQMEPTRSI